MNIWLYDFQIIGDVTNMLVGPPLKIWFLSTEHRETLHFQENLFLSLDGTNNSKTCVNDTGILTMRILILLLSYEIYQTASLRYGSVHSHFLHCKS